MRVAIVNDQRLATEALRRVVTSDPAHEVAWTAVDGYGAVQKCQQDLPDVILMDVRMPHLSGIEAAKQITKREGLMVGISAGGNAWAALQVARRPENKGKCVVTVMCDTGERYLSTWLFENVGE